MKSYTHPNPKAVAQVTSCKQQQYRNTSFRPKAKGKNGVTQKGLLKMIKDAKKKGEPITELQRQALGVVVHCCEACGCSFRYASQLARHVEREHKESKKWIRLATLGVGYVCKACGDSSLYFADGRALKGHYLDRQIHGAKEVMRAGVKLWAISNCPEDREAVREVYEDCGIIEPAEKDRGDDSDYETD